MLFALKKYLGGFLMPLPFMLLLILAGLLLLWFSRWQKTGKTLITVSWLGLVLLSLQPVADALLLTTEKPYEKRYELITRQKFSNGTALYRGARRRLYL